jgi:Cu+-exporting ATPase
MIEEKLGIDGMHCTNCSRSVERAFAKQEGIDVHVLLAENAGIFAYDERVWNRAKIGKELKKIGFALHRESKIDAELIRLAIGVAFSLPLMVCMVLMMAGVDYPHAVNYVQFGLCTVVMGLLGLRYYRGAVRDITQRILGMDVLVALGTTTAYVYSTVLLFGYHEHMLYFDTAAMLLTIISVGKYIEGKSKVKSAAALKELMALQSDTALVLTDGQTCEVDVKEVAADAIILVPQGAKVPLDGEVTAGVADVDEAMLTGESMPVTKRVGDKVYAGTVVRQGNMQVRVSGTDKDTYLASIIAKVDQIQQEKPHIQHIADRVATVFVPSVLVICAVCFAVSYWAMGLSLADAINRAVAVLVISCPCSLGLAAPLSIVVGTTRAGKMGILYQNSEVFEKLHRIDCVCLDKTGTISTGQLAVTEADSDRAADDVAYTMESISQHPIAKAICTYLAQKGATVITEMQPQEVVGVGVTCDEWRMDKVNDRVRLTRDGQVVATYTVADTIKEDAKATIEKMAAAGVETYMLTGDSKEVAERVAKEVGLNSSNVYSQIRPEDKCTVIEKLQSEGKKVAFAGDGINDSPALSQADFAIAMGTGADVAKTLADITVVGNSLMQVYHGLRLSQKVYRNIIENFIWAFSYNLIAIPLAFAGILPPLVAGLCMAFSNVTVVGNALRLKRTKLE